MILHESKLDPPDHPSFSSPFRLPFPLPHLGSYVQLRDLPEDVQGVTHGLEQHVAHPRGGHRKRPEVHSQNLQPHGKAGGGGGGEGVNITITNLVNMMITIIIMILR